MVGDILQPTHLIFVLAIALLVLGPKRLPEVGRSLGKGLRDFKEAISGEEHPRPEELEAPAADAVPPQTAVHAPPQTAVHAPPQTAVHAPPQTAVHAPPQTAVHAPPVEPAPATEPTPAPVGSSAGHEHAR